MTALALESAQAVADEAVRVERARCVAIVRAAARDAAVHAAVARHLLRVAARTATIGDLMKQGAHLGELVARAEALTEAAAAIEEEPTI